MAQKRTPGLLKNGNITTHYSSAELLNLWQAANKVCERVDEGKAELTMLAIPSLEKLPNSIFLLQ